MTPETPMPTRIDETLALVARLPPVPSGPRSVPQLDALFAALHGEEGGPSRAEAEDLIWALWCAHEDETARTALQRAIGLIARHELAEAERVLDGVVAAWPDWAEGWNKRATLYFMQERDAESVADIRRALALEPRHFGALSGLGQLALRAGEETAAYLAFEHALRANPNLAAVREAVDALRPRVRLTLH